MDADPQETNKKGGARPVASFAAGLPDGIPGAESVDWRAILPLLCGITRRAGSKSFFAERPAGVEGWLPIAALMNLKVLLGTGDVPTLHPAGMFLLLAFLGMSWLARKSFCSWLCPVGTVSEYLWKLGRRTFGRNFRLPRAGWIHGLRGLQEYLLMGLFLFAVASMSIPAIRSFLEGPYGLLDDVKMLNFFRYLGAGLAAW